jgi:predicted DNA-binding protein
MTARTKIQVPIRISKEQHQRFTSISKQTRIPMSILARDALERHLSDIETNGIQVVLNQAIVTSNCDL